MIRAVKLLASLLVVTWAGTAAAVPCPLVCVLADGNSVLEVDHLFGDGVYSFDVDGVEQLSGPQWFWVRTGPGGSGAPGREFRLDDEVTNFGSGTGFALVGSDLVGNTLALTYAGRGLQARLVWTLTGGAASSGASEVSIDTALTNTSGAPLDVAWFEFADFDVNGSNGMETAVFQPPARICQTDAPTGVSLCYETTRTPRHWEIRAEFTPGQDDLLDLLDDAQSTQLGDTGSPFGPGDAEFALQHDLVSLPNADSISYTITMSVPEPGSIPGSAAALVLTLAALRANRAA